MRSPQEPVDQSLIKSHAAWFDGQKTRLDRSHVFSAVGEVLLRQVIGKIDHDSSFWDTSADNCFPTHPA